MCTIRVQLVWKARESRASPARYLSQHCLLFRAARVQVAAKKKMNNVILMY